jgi:antitoxin component of MazEF toxin-antitoxin module
MLELKVRKIGNSLGIVFPKGSLLRLRPMTCRSPNMAVHNVTRI